MGLLQTVSRISSRCLIWLQPTTRSLNRGLEDHNVAKTDRAKPEQGVHLLNIGMTGITACW